MPALAWLALGLLACGTALLWWCALVVQDGIWRDVREEWADGEDAARAGEKPATRRAMARKVYNEKGV